MAVCSEHLDENKDSDVNWSAPGCYLDRVVWEAAEKTQKTQK